ncbi:MAG: hypothetical protein UCV58_07410 [Clostridium saudiense]|nr:hypothetical protein [Clostridium saudiense]
MNCKFSKIEIAFACIVKSLLEIPFTSIKIGVSGRVLLTITALDKTQILETTPTRVTFW